MYFEIIFELWQSQSTELNIAFDLFVQLSVSSAFRKKNFSMQIDRGKSARVKYVTGRSERWSPERNVRGETLVGEYPATVTDLGLLACCLH